MPKAYLTIDDSPSPVTTDLVDALDERGIKALFFCRGDRLENNPEAAIYAIRQGHIIGNHSYAHRRSGGLSFEEWKQDLQQTEELIESAYKQADTERPGRYYRFPYLDRGDGETLERFWPEIIERVFAGEEYQLAENDKMRQMQNYLQERGFTQPFTELNHPLLKKVPAIAKAHDVLLTDTTQDWKMLARHLANEETTLDDLKSRIAADPFVKQGGCEHVTLIHDDPEIYNISLALVDYMIEELDFEFQNL